MSLFTRGENCFSEKGWASVVIVIGVLLAAAATGAYFAKYQNQIFPKFINDKISSGDTNQEINDLTTQLIEDNKSLAQETIPNAERTEDLAVVAAKRQEALIDQIKNDPGAVSNLAPLTTQMVQAQNKKDPVVIPQAVEPYVEKETTITGTLAQFHYDDAMQDKSMPGFFLTPDPDSNSTHTTYEVYFDKGIVPVLNSKVTVKGLETGTVFFVKGITTISASVQGVSTTAGNVLGAVTCDSNHFTAETWKNTKKPDCDKNGKQVLTYKCDKVTKIITVACGATPPPAPRVTPPATTQPSVPTLPNTPPSAPTCDPNKFNAGTWGTPDIDKCDKNGQQELTYRCGSAKYKIKQSCGPTAPTPPTAGPYNSKALVIMLKFSDSKTPSLSKQEMENILLNNPDSAKHYYEKQAFNKVQVSGTVTEWLTLPQAKSVDQSCDDMKFLNWTDPAKKAAEQQGYNPDSYQFVVYVWPDQLRECVPGAVWGNQMFINGEDWVRNENVMLHEYGHFISPRVDDPSQNGVNHASYLKCGSSGCAFSEYGDRYTRMGTPNLMNWTGVHKLALGWLPPSVVQNVTSSGSYKINALGGPDNGIQLLKIVRPDQASESYYVEYRRDIRYDPGKPDAKPIDLSKMIEGATIRIWDGRAGDFTYLLDTTPETPTPGNNGDPGNPDEALADGRSFLPNPANKVRFTQVSHDSSSAMIQVDFGADSNTPPVIPPGGGGTPATPEPTSATNPTTEPQFTPTQAPSEPIGSPVSTATCRPPVSDSANKKRVFVTSSLYNGDLKTQGSNVGLGAAKNGLDGADKICQSLANAKGLGGTWKAWISSLQGSAYSRLVHHGGPYVRLDGQVIAANWFDLTTSGARVPVNVTENNIPLERLLPVWTDTNNEGLLAAVVNQSCNNWQDGTQKYNGRNGNTGKNNWTDTSESDGCDAKRALFCFEQ